MTELELWRESLPADLRQPDTALTLAIIGAHLQNARHEIDAAIVANCAVRSALMQLPPEILREVRRG